jgi:hypothetical protein
MASIIVVGGGWAGCAAALAAGRTGEDVLLLERTDMLLGTGLAGGIMKNNGRWTATEEFIGMGGGQIFQTIEKTYLHRDIDFPGQAHASIYDVTKIEAKIRNTLESASVHILIKCRAKGVVKRRNRIEAIVTDRGDEIKGDVFIDASGSTGPQRYCIEYGSGCAMCILRCPSFGGRVSLVEKAGVKEKKLIGPGRKYGRISGACSLLKSSLSKKVSNKISQYGKLEIPLPQELISSVGSTNKSCPQYGDMAFKEKLVFLDNGHAKLMTPYMPLEKLRQISGFENAIYADPFSGGNGNSIRYLSIAPTDIYLRTEGLENLFCAGEKIGPIAGHTEAIVTGVIAGHNAVLLTKRKKLFSPSGQTASGDFICSLHDMLAKRGGTSEIFTFSGSVYFERMKALGLYRTDRDEIKKTIRALGLQGILG